MKTIHSLLDDLVPGFVLITLVYLVVIVWAITLTWPEDGSFNLVKVTNAKVEIRK